MNLNPNLQTNLYGLQKHLMEMINLYDKDKLPNKILLSGKKGIGKFTLANHLINYILSLDEEFSYDLKNFKIDENNRSFRLTLNQSHPNLNKLDVLGEKRSIEISQIRNLISVLNKSALNSKPRFILIDNIEYLNTNSINALLKILEEPSFNTFFILIHNNKKVLTTLLSRCLNFKISLTNSEIIEISNKLLNTNLNNIVNKDLLNYYFSPGEICNLVKYSEENNIDLSKIDLKKYTSLLVNEVLKKKNSLDKDILYSYIEFFLIKKVYLKNANTYNYFINRIMNTKKFNLDEESLFLEFKLKLLDE